MGLLRALLALSVLFAHMDKPWMIGGQQAVQLFFMVSGFLIAHVLATNPNYEDAGRFYRNRALRLFPVYYAVLLLALAWKLCFEPGFFGFYQTASFWPALFVGLSNLLVFGQDWAMFLQDGKPGLAFAPDFRVTDPRLHWGLAIPQAWSLGVELCFYLVAPFTLRHPRRILALLALSLAVRWWTYQAFGAHDPWTYRFFPSELALFLVGSLSHRYLLPLWRKAAAHWPRLHVDRLAVWGMALYLCFYPYAPLPGEAKQWLLYAGFAASLPLFFLYQNRHRFDKALGELSYPVYLNHLLCIGVVNHLVGLGGVPLAEPLRILVVVAASMGLAHLLNRLIDARLRARRASLRGEAPVL